MSSVLIVRAEWTRLKSSSRGLISNTNQENRIFSRIAFSNHSRASRAFRSCSSHVADCDLAQNLVLFYALLSKHLTEMFPIVYTPTEADAIADYSHLFRRSEGLFLTLPEGVTMEADFLDACEGRQLDLVSTRIMTIPVQRD